jgi:LEA14-like dessication related protein
MALQNSDPTVIVNGNALYITPNSLEVDDGLGEQKVLVQSAGNGVLDTVYANDVETNLGMVKFSLRNTDANQQIARQLKANLNQNVITIPSNTSNGLNRTYTQMAMTNNYKVPFSPDGVIEVEFMGQKPSI